MPSPEERINVLEQRADKIEQNLSNGFSEQSKTLLGLLQRVETHDEKLTLVAGVQKNTHSLVESLHAIAKVHDRDIGGIDKRLIQLEAPNPIITRVKAVFARVRAKLPALPSWQTLLVLAAAGFMFAKSQGCELPIPWPPPTPDVDPVPIPKAGLRVLLVEESADRQTHTAAFLGSQEIRKYMAEKCAKGPDGKTPEFRVYDKDNPGESPVWQEALKLPRESLPWLIISNPPKGYSGPLPKAKTEQLELLKKYGG